MGIDIRLPLGILFLLLGAILVVYGAASNPSLYGQSLGINVNFDWGVVLFAFGALMFLLSRFGARGGGREKRAVSAFLRSLRAVPKK